MKRGVWDKKKLTGAELRGKTARALRARTNRPGSRGTSARVRHGNCRARPVHFRDVAASLGIHLLSLDDMCEVADYISLHLPATTETRHLFGRHGSRSASAACGSSTPRAASSIDETALASAIESGHVAGAALDVFEVEPPKDWRLAQLAQVVATPHIAASTAEAQELVGLETAAAVRDYLTQGVIRNAVNFPAIAADEMLRLQPYLTLAEQLGALVVQLAEGRTKGISVRLYGPLVGSNSSLIVSAAVNGLLRPLLSSGVTIVNARDVAKERGIEIVESHSSRARNFANIISVKVHTSEGERWLEGTVFEPARPRLTLLDGIEIEAPLEGTLLVIKNADKPGVIGQIGSILGRHSVNIANFALGRDEAGAVGVVKLDATPDDAGLASALPEIRATAAVREARVARVS